MRIYLDDDSVHALLLRLLRQAGHDVQRPVDLSASGQDDPVQLSHAIRNDRVLLSHNHQDFEKLHALIMVAQGHHPGILIVRRDNDPTRDMTVRGIVTALKKLIAANVPLRDQFHVLNQWR
jgi:predicted nuclease of predicted toxin-antitoxin system